MLSTGFRKKKSGKGGGVNFGGGNDALVDPKVGALNALGIDLGNKNIRALQRTDVDSAFVRQLSDSVVYMDTINVRRDGECRNVPDTLMSSVKILNRLQFQRKLHESYQYIVKILDDFEIEKNKRNSRPM